MSFKARVYLTYGLALLLVLSLAILGIHSLARVRESSRVIVEENFASLLAVERMLFSLDEQDRARLLYLLEGSELSQSLFLDQEQTFKVQLQLAARNATSDYQKELIRSLGGGHQALLFEYHQPTQLAGALSTEELVAHYYADFHPRLDTLRDLLRQLRQQDHQQLAEASRTVQSEAREAATVMTWATAAILALGGLLALGLGRHLETLEMQRAGVLRQERLAASEAELASRSKDRFLANVTHDLRTPLAGILGVLELLQQTELTDEQEDYLATAEGSARSLLTLVSDLLDVSRIEAGRLEFQDLLFAPGQLAEQVVQLLAPTARDKSLGLHLEKARELPELVRGDPDRVRQVLVNLLSNALKFTEEGAVKRNRSGGAIR